jgi:hypothetical protein
LAIMMSGFRMSDRKIWHCGTPGQEGVACVKCFSSLEAAQMAGCLARLCVDS